MQRFVRLLPIQPSYRVVLTIAVVVALLAVTELVIRQQHGRAVGKEQRGKQGFGGVGAVFQNCRIFGFAFDAVVVADVFVMPVAVVFAVGVVVFFVVADQITQRKAVMRGDEIDAGRRMAAAVVENIRRPRQTFGKRAQIDYEIGRASCRERV